MIVNTELANSKGCSEKDKWETPAKVFDPLMEEFSFTLDPCCEIETAKVSLFFTPEQDGLSRSWRGHTVFCNPPYSRDNIGLWVEKCYKESRKPGTLVVALLPVSTSAKWFHKWVWNKAELRFYKGRIRFKGAPFSAPFSSMLAIYKTPGLSK